MAILAVLAEIDRFFEASMALPWACYGSAMGLPWVCYGSAMGLLWVCPVFSSALTFQTNNIWPFKQNAPFGTCLALFHEK
jgi:hypothetical protein